MMIIIVKITMVIIVIIMIKIIMIIIVKIIMVIIVGIMVCWFKTSPGLTSRAATMLLPCSSAA